MRNVVGDGGDEGRIEDGGDSDDGRNGDDGGDDMWRPPDGDGEFFFGVLVCSSLFFAGFFYLELCSIGTDGGCGYDLDVHV